MQHLLEISQLSTCQIESILRRAAFFKRHKKYPVYTQHSIANLFYENSTRTRISFEMAAHHLSMQVVNIDMRASSENKGEVIQDTLNTLTAMGLDAFVIRHQQNGIQQQLAQQVSESVHIINAGDGTHAHPSQAILDMMTIIEKRPQLERLKIAVVGNIRHSRVANSFQCICAHLGVGELVLVAPKLWQPEVIHYGHVTDDLKAGLSDADVVMCLRVQTERFNNGDHLDLDTYKKNFALTQTSLSYAKPEAMVLHPGPINRGVEIETAVADGKQSCILQQVANGVYARMAIIEALINPDFFE